MQIALKVVCALSKYRICYSQGEEVKFISHLDFLRTIVRTFRRAELPVKYSEGFNPHMVMTIGLPLSVGTTSVCDCLEVELTEDIDIPAAIDKINAAAPRGIKVLGIKSAEGLTPMYGIDSADYTAEFTTDKSVSLEEYIAADEVMIEKKSKRKINEVNIKDFIRGIEVVSTDGTSHSLKLHLNAGNTSNLKPELVLKSMEKFFDCSISDICIERKQIYFEDMTTVF